MKKIIYTLLLIGCVVSIQAQDIVLKGTKALSLNKEAYFPTFGKSNNEILISGPNYKGLSLYNEIKNSLVEISDKEGAGYKPQCDEYGIITYQTTIIKKGRKQQKHYQYNPDNGISSLINEPNKKIIKTSGQQIIINYNGSQKKIAPLGNVYYIWASMSPDQTKVLFTAISKGTFVCDLDGKIMAELGYLNAPVWATDNWVVGMNDIDNHDEVTQSTIEAVNINTQNHVSLTSASDFIAVYPQVSKNANKLVFHTPSGKIYSSELIIKE